MAPLNGLPGSVDIINQKTGDVVTQYRQSADRVVNLSQTSIVRVNASPESVNFYEREGNDLIVHMKDGTTVRYQSFFVLDENGLHSELIFEDNLGAHHAVFPFAAEAGPLAAEPIVPAISEVAVDSLIGAGGISGLAVLGGLAAVGGIVGVAAASGGGGGAAVIMMTITAVAQTRPVVKIPETLAIPVNPATPVNLEIPVNPVTPLSPEIPASLAILVNPATPVFPASLR